MRPSADMATQVLEARGTFSHVPCTCDEAHHECACMEAEMIVPALMQVPIIMSTHAGGKGRFAPDSREGAGLKDAKQHPQHEEVGCAAHGCKHHCTDSP